MCKEELDLIRELNVSDQEKLQIFKETKFKELDEETNQVRIKEEEKTKQEEEKTKQEIEKTNQMKVETEQLRVKEETNQLKIKEEFETERNKYNVNSQRSISMVSAVEHIFVGIIDDYIEIYKNKNSENNKTDNIENIDYTAN